MSLEPLHFYDIQTSTSYKQKPSKIYGFEAPIFVEKNNAYILWVNKNT